MSMQEPHRRRTVMDRLRHGTLGALLVLAVAACQDEPTGTANGETPGGTMEGKYHVGYVLGPDGRPEKIVFEEMGGDAVIEGDIVIGLAADVPRTPEAAFKAGPAGNARFSMAVSDTDDYWPGGVVPYRFKENVTDETRDNALKGMALINRRIDGIRFVPATNLSEPYVLIQDDHTTVAEECRAEVGRRTSGATDAYLKGCNPGTSAHEFMHNLGFHHEHRRCDRDDYIDITSTLAANRNWLLRCSDYTYGLTTYDLLSVMHYPSSVDGFNGVKVDMWVPFERVDASAGMGQRDSLSNCDNLALDVIYPSTGTPVCDRPYVSFASYHAQGGHWGTERGFLVDDGDDAFTRSTSWSYTSDPSGQDYDRHYYTVDTTKRGWYTFSVPTNEVYNVYMWAFRKTGVTPGTAVYTLFAGPAPVSSTSTPLQTWEWNQSQGLQWSLLSKTTLQAGTYTLQIQKKGGTTGTIFADAIRVTKDLDDPVN